MVRKLKNEGLIESDARIKQIKAKVLEARSHDKLLELLILIKTVSESMSANLGDIENYSKQIQFFKAKFSDLELNLKLENLEKALADAFERIEDHRRMAG
jgi:hypothetical protein